MTYDQIRFVRRLLVLVFAAFGSLVVHQFYVSLGKKSAPVDAPVASEPDDPLARQVELTRLDAEGRTTFVLRAAESLGRSEETQTFRDVEIEFAAGKERVPLVIVADNCRFDTATSAAHLEGDVVIRDQESLRIETASLEYRREPDRVWSDAPVRFLRRDLSGESGRLVYDVPSASFELLDGVSVNITGSWETPVHIRSRTARMRRRESLVQFVDDVVADQVTQQLRCNDLQVYLTADESSVERFDAYENVELVIEAGTRPSDQESRTGDSNRARLLSEPGTKRLYARKLEVFFRPGGEALERARALEGARLVMESAEDPQGKRPLIRELAGYLLAFDFDSEGRLTDLRGRGGVTLTVKPREGRTGDEKELTARQLEARFDVETGDLLEARCLEAVEFRQGEVRATAEVGVYEPAAEVLTLSGAPRLWDSETTVEAETIRVGVASGDLEAMREVRTTLSRQGAGEGLFPGRSQEPVHFVAGHLTYGRAQDLAVYTGSARGLQGENRVEADRIEIRQGQGALHAAGAVKTVFLHGGDEPKTLRRTLTRSERLDYSSQEAVLHYRQGVVMEGEDMVLRGQQIDVALQEDGTTVSEVRAEVDVEIQTREGRAKGDTARYLPKTEQVQVIGDNASLVSDDKLTEGKELTFFLSNDRIFVDGQERSRTRTIYTSKPRPM